MFCALLLLLLFHRADDSHLELAEPHVYRGLDWAQPLRHVRRLPPQGEEGGLLIVEGKGDDKYLKSGDTLSRSWLWLL